MHHDDFDCWLVLGVRSRPLDLMRPGGGPPQGASQKGNQVNQIQPRLGSKEHLDVFGGVSLFHLNFGAPRLHIFSELVNNFLNKLR